MFTGIIEELGTILTVKKGASSSILTIKSSKVLENTNIGDSIAVNGVCLTVVSQTVDSFKADVMAETIRRSSLGKLKIGDKVNLERAMQLNGRFGGHIVSGHIDGVGTISNFSPEDNAVWITINTSPDVLKYIVHKGSVTIDGISLTVAYVDEKCFKVSIIPHTASETTLLSKKKLDIVNLECDVIGKYVEKLLNPLSKPTVDADFLAKHGFM